MQKTALRLVKTDSAHQVKTSPTSSESGSIPTSKIEIYARDWISDCEYQQLSPCTLDIRRFVLEKLLWFQRDRGHETCGLSELRQFLAHATNGHTTEAGRWGDPRSRKPLRPRTIHTYYGHLRTFFEWLVSEGYIDASPMLRINAPVFRKDQVQPFTEEQVVALLHAARRSQHPRRDEAIVLFLLDTGVRATELCGLRMKSLDIDNRRCTVLGKGNFQRTVYFGRTTAKALWQYIREDGRDPDQSIFVGDRGTRSGEALTRSGLLQLIVRLGKAAGIQATRCSPHTFRHTFAVNWLRGGGNAFSLQQMLGHTSLDQTQTYIALAQGDVQSQHRQFSPADRLKARH
jgi:integrase/recombinase XerD